MNLMFPLSEADQAALDAALRDREKLLYCIPFNVHDGRFVDGYVAVTNLAIYTLLGGEVLNSYLLKDASDFKTEVMYGNCGFYGEFDGHAVLICQFISGRNLPRYAVVARACNLLAADKHDKSLTNDSPELFCEKCGRPYINHSTVCPYCLDKKQVYKQLWAMTKGLRFMMCFPFIVAAVGIIFSFVSPWISAKLINEYIAPPPGVDRGTMSGFLVIVGVVILIDLFQRVLSVIQRRLSCLAGTQFSHILRVLLYEKVQSLSLSAIQRYTPGDLMTRINGDINNMYQFIVFELPNLFVQFGSLIVAVVVLLFMDWKICLFVSVPVPIVVYIMLKFWAFMHPRDKKMWHLGARNSHLLQDILSGIRIVKCFGQEEKEIDRFVKANKRQADMSEANTRLAYTVFGMLAFLVRIGFYLIMLYGYYLVFHDKMQLGTMHQYTSYSNIIYGPLRYITGLSGIISTFVTSSSKVFELLQERPDIIDTDLPIDIKIEGDIEIKNVTFGYSSYDPVLEDVSVSIKAGEMIGIVGHSGCGKSTLINLIMRLYDPDAGQIVIDDVDIRDISQQALRSQIGVVLQETFLFSGTIAENIRYSAPFATDEEVIAAAKLANAHDFILSLPHGYNTKVGEKGYSLSGGERQRIAIARAVIHNPRILILDEATAALDTETEKNIQDALNKLVRNRTTLAIAHRLSTLRNADKLLVLDKGKVAEFGTHDELLEAKGVYYRLVMAQRKMAQGIAK